MDDEWLVALATSGATTLVTAAATDAWHEALAGFRKLFGHGDPERENLAEHRLTAAAAKIERADETTRDGVREAEASIWSTGLADLLEEEPDQAEALRALIGRVEALLPQAENGRVAAIGTGHVETANSGGINIANSGAIRDITLHGESHGTAE